MHNLHRGRYMAHRGPRRAGEPQWTTEGQLSDSELQTESETVNVADDIFDFAEKAQLFSTSSQYASDCVITLKGDKEVHVQRGLLSLHSEYFKEHFAKDNSDRIALSTVDHDEFIEILCVIYPSGHPITARNVEAISKLAYQLKMPDLLKRCHVFLMSNNTKLSKSKLLLIAQEYDLKRLQAHYVKDYKNTRDVQAIQDEPEYASLNDHTRRMLFDNIIEANSSCRVNRGGIRYGYDKAKYESEILEALALSTSCPPDIVLVVEDIQIQAHKQFLSVYSDYFNTMFQSKFQEGRENVVVLEGIGYEEMLEFLSVIYPTDYPITDKNLGTILKLADRFIMPTILARCKKVLKSTNTIKGALKLWYAQQYNLVDLQEEFARQYISIAHVLGIKVEPEFEALNDKTRALLLNGITQQSRYC